MRKKLCMVFILLLGVIGIVSVNSKDLVGFYDDMFKTNKITLYTNGQITDDTTFYNNVYQMTQIHQSSEYYNSYNDYSNLKLGVQNCNYSNMTCDFRLNREKYSNGTWTNDLVKEYLGIKVNVDSDIDEYFTMVKDNKVIINYDESMFKNESEKNNYINSYFNSFSSGNSNVSVGYRYDSMKKNIIRTEYSEGIYSNIMIKKIEGIEFKYTETEYSEEFKKLTSGILTIKSDVAIDRELLSNYLMSMNFDKSSFSIDGEIVNNKVFIKRNYYQDGVNKTVESHLVTLVQDSNIDLEPYNKAGLDSQFIIKANKPEKNISEYLMYYFNQIYFVYDLDDGGTERFDEVYSYDDTEYVILRYSKVNSDYETEKIQFHKIPINFVGYSDVVSDLYNKKVGNEIVVAADSLDLNTINMHLNHNPSALGCNDDYSYCDIGYYDYETKTFEIHNIKVILNNEVSDAFKKAFNIKEDGTIDIIVGNDVFVQYFNPYFYIESTKDTLNYSCYNINSTSSSKKCTLSLKNYNKKISETHDVEYSIIKKDTSKAFSSLVNSSINFYPGEYAHAWGNLSNAYSLFSKGSRDRISIGQCNSVSKVCPVMVINDNNVLEVQNTKISVLEGKSPEFSKFFKGNTIKLNSIYKDDSNYLFRASMAYLMSETKTWSFLDDFSNGTANLIFNNIEAHKMNIEYAEGNEEHKKIIDEVVKKIGRDSISVEIDDLEFVNDFYYRDDKADFSAPNYNSKILNDYLGNIIDNKHISYFLAVEGGYTGPFMKLFGGQLVLYYDGIAYDTSDAIVETVFRNIIYIPNDTEDSVEAYVAAAQKRIDDYLGKKNGVVVSFSRILDEDEISDYGFVISNELDANVYRLTYKKKTEEFLIIKDSSKMKQSTFNAVDVNNNVNVSSKNANYPTNTVVSSDKIKDNDEYKKYLKKLGVDEAEVVDINLYSPTIGEIDTFNNVEFDVNVPIDTKVLDDKELYAYYISDDGKIEEYPVVVDDFMATFKTNHFSTYIITEKAKVNLNNPNTFDGIILYIILGCVSIVVLGIGVYSFRKNNC